tara:strand:- start:1239 stop:1592 length:354 start_codon:yes stop_codon:yes gene_type:complete
MKTKRYRTISEVSNLLNINQHVIRYWDAKFDGISVRLKDNKQRLFNIDNINKIKQLKNILYENGKNNYPLSMAKKLIEKENQKTVNFDNSKVTQHQLFDINELKNISSNLKKILNNI